MSNYLESNSFELTTSAVALKRWVVILMLISFLFNIFSLIILLFASIEGISTGIGSAVSISATLTISILIIVNPLIYFIIYKLVKEFRSIADIRVNKLDKFFLIALITLSLLHFPREILACLNFYYLGGVHITGCISLILYLITYFVAFSFLLTLNLLLKQIKTKYPKTRLSSGLIILQSIFNINFASIGFLNLLNGGMVIGELYSYRVHDPFFIGTLISIIISLIVFLMFLVYISNIGMKLTQN